MKSLICLSLIQEVESPYSGCTLHGDCLKQDAQIMS